MAGLRMAELGAAELRMADDCLLSPEERDPRGLGFHRRGGNASEDLEPEEPVDFVAWGEAVCGVVVHGPHMEGQWFYVPGRGFLPLALGTKQVLVMERAFEVALDGGGHDLRYRSTTSNHEEIVNEFVPRGSVVVGFPCCDGEFVWVRGRGYIPLRIQGRIMLSPVLGTAGHSPSVHGGLLTWMLLDDQDKHWGAVGDRFNKSTYGEIKRASTSVHHIPAPPWSFSTDRHTIGINEKFTRHWHIVLSGGSLLQGGPRPRYRVSVKTHLSSSGPSNFSPEKCPGPSPLAWLQRMARQGYTSYISD